MKKPSEDDLPRALYCYYSHSPEDQLSSSIKRPKTIQENDDGDENERN